MLFRSVNEPAAALLAKGMDQSTRHGRGEHLIASSSAFAANDLQGKLTGIEWPAGERFLA
jgi:hypothetical protein